MWIERYDCTSLLLFLSKFYCFLDDCLMSFMKDRKSTRLNSSHVSISYAVFCFVHLRALHSFPTRRSSDLLSTPSEASIVSFSDCGVIYETLVTFFCNTTEGCG